MSTIKIDSSSSSSTVQNSPSLLVGGQYEANKEFDRILTEMYGNRLTTHKLLDIYVAHEISWDYSFKYSR